VNGQAEGEYTGRELRRVVTYIMSGIGLDDNVVCMALASPPSINAVDPIDRAGQEGPTRA
jgi:hypothetical protein